jgi:hypothetical protein
VTKTGFFQVEGYAAKVSLAVVDAFCGFPQGNRSYKNKTRAGGLAKAIAFLFSKLK